MVEKTEEAAYSEQDEALAKESLAKKNFYEILGVEKDASEDQIKKAYRKLALKLHPDKNRAPSANEAFKQVGKAYACLSDAGKRRNYDTFGEDSPGVNFNDINIDEIFKQAFGNADLGDIFAQAFGQGFRQTRGGHRGGGSPLDQIFAEMAQGMAQGMAQQMNNQGGSQQRVFRNGNSQFMFQSFGGPGMSGGFATFGGPQMRRQNPNVEEKRAQHHQDRINGHVDDANDNGVSSQSKARRDQTLDDLLFNSAFGGNQGGRPQTGMEFTEVSMAKICQSCFFCCAFLVFIVYFILNMLSNVLSLMF